jgi:hypothetical protein
MTPDEWEAATEPQQMLRFVRDKASDRRLRLFACACLRRVLTLLGDSLVNRKTVEFAERFADGLATRNELHGQAWGPPGRASPVVLWSAFAAAETAAQYGAGVVRLSAVGRFPLGTAGSSADLALVEEMMSPEQQAWAEAAEQDERLAQAHAARDIIGNPFRPVAFDPRWRTADTVGLARAIYEDRAFERVPLLTDALMDAGCGDNQLLAHCRSDGPHVRGCFAVDLVLGKE